MKILFINSSDTNGGAARATYRLLEGLRMQDVEVNMLVRDKNSNNPAIISCFEYDRKGLIGKIDKLIWKIKNRIRKQKWKQYPDKEPVFLNDLNSISLLNAIQNIDFDILHLHFVANRFLDLRELKKIEKPIVWTLHDCWPFTGICHYFYDCVQYQKSCGHCPFLHSEVTNDLSHIIWKRKKKIYQNFDLQIVTTSNWLSKCSIQSSLFKNFPTTVIPNGLDIGLFSPDDKENACQQLGLNKSTQKIIFGAFNALNDTNKGFEKLLSAITYLEKNIDCGSIELLIFGTTKPIEEIKTQIPIHYLGFLTQEKEIVNAFNAANVMVVPSLSENLSNAIMESLACGTPVVAFDIGGNSDMIEHKKNGYLAEPFLVDDLAKGIVWCLNNNLNNNLSNASRKKAEENFDSVKIVRQYLQLYSNLLAKHVALKDKNRACCI